MNTFQLRRAVDVADAVNAGAMASTAQQGAQVRFLAGGTTLIDLMKLNVEHPAQVIDINRLELNRIETLSNGETRIGALVRNADLANHETIRTAYPVLSQALLSGASAQLRNMATTGGNLLQRTRCVYLRDTSMACNKRVPGSGCPAITGMNRNLAILGTSTRCIATNPSDMNVALTALEAVVHIEGKTGARSVVIDDFFLLPGDTPERENMLVPGDLITHVTLGPQPDNSRSAYLKLRDRASYEFALASAAVVAKVSAGKIEHVRIAMGGVGTKPWRSKEAEAALLGRAPGPDVFRNAAQAALRDAHPQSQNGFKVELATRCLMHTLERVTRFA